jgi:protein-L-isoaspartate(D-aspartate) O-methyltransferase
MAQLSPSSFMAARPGASESGQMPAECVELMLSALELTGAERVLETGSSSGYETALLSRLARDVVSLESDQAKAEGRLAVLGALGCDNVRLFLGQGSVGWPGEGPYDAILVAGGASRVPAELLDQLGIGGRLVIPLGDASGQVLELVQKNLDGVSSRALGTSHLPMLPWSRRPSFFPWNREKRE